MRRKWLFDVRIPLSSLSSPGSNVGRGAGEGKLSEAGGTGWWGPAQEEPPTPLAALLHGAPADPYNLPHIFPSCVALSSGYHKPRWEGAALGRVLRAQCARLLRVTCRA